MKKALFLLLAVPLFAQQTVVQPLFLNNTSGSVTTATTLIKNIGQVGHIVQVVFSNAPAHTCVALANSATGSFQMSFDGNTWIPIGGPLTDGNVFFSAARTYYASGIANYYRFALTWSDTTNCVASAWYDATSATGFLNSISGVNSVGDFLSSPTNGYSGAPLYVAGLGSQRLTPLYTCDQNVSVTVAAGSTAQLLAADTGSTVVHVCAFAATLSAAGTVQFVYGTGANCGTGTGSITPAFNLAANTPFTLGSGLGSVLTYPPLKLPPTAGGNRPALCVAATGGIAQVYISFAYGG